MQILRLPRGNNGLDDTDHRNLSTLKDLGHQVGIDHLSEVSPMLNLDHLPPPRPPQTRRTTAVVGAQMHTMYWYLVLSSSYVVSHESSSPFLYFEGQASDLEAYDTHAHTGRTVAVATSSAAILS